MHAFGICGSQASGIIEYLADGSWTKRLHPGLGRPRGRDRGAARARRLHRAGDGLRGRARLLRGLRGRPRAGAAGGAAREPGARRGRSGQPHLQALPVRLDRASLHGLRAAPPGAPPAAARGHRRDPLPHRGGPDPAPLGAARGQAPAEERLRGEVQPALPARLDPGQRPGHPRRLHRRGGARRDAARGGRPRSTTTSTRPSTTRATSSGTWRCA